MLEHFKIHSVVASMIASKLKTADQWRPSPDAPNDEEAREYQCVILDKISTEEFHIREKSLSLTARLSQKSGRFNMYKNVFGRGHLSAMLHVFAGPLFKAALLFLHCYMFLKEYSVIL